MGKRGPKSGTGGRRKKPLTDKILEGKKNITVLEFPEMTEPEDLPNPPAFLTDASKTTGNWSTATEIYNSVIAWLEKTGCLSLIPPEHLSEYSLLKARWLECEMMNSKHGLLAKHPTTGQPMQSPYVAIGLQYLKAADSTWTKIWQVVAENSKSDYKHGNPNDDIMEALLSRHR